MKLGWAWSLITKMRCSWSRIPLEFVLGRTITVVFMPSVLVSMLTAVIEEILNAFWTR